MIVFGTHNSRLNTPTQVFNHKNSVEKGYSWEVLGASNKPCPKSRKATKENKLINGEYGKISGLEKTRSKIIEGELKNVNSALDLFSSFFSTQVKLSPVTTTTTGPPETPIFTTSSTTILIEPELSSSSNTNVPLIFDSDHIEVVDFIDDDIDSDGTGDCCWFDKWL